MKKQAGEDKINAFLLGLTYGIIIGIMPFMYLYLKSKENIRVLEDEVSSKNEAIREAKEEIEEFWNGGGAESMEKVEDILEEEESY